MHTLTMMALAAALLAPLAAEAQFKCVGADGSTTFQQQACASGATQSRLDVQTPRPADAAPGPRAVPEQVRADAMARERRVRELQFEIRDTELRIDDRSAEMKRELQRLRQQKSKATNTLAGATFQQSISTEMQAVTSKFQALNDIDLEHLKQLRGELATAQSALNRGG